MHLDLTARWRNPQNQIHRMGRAPITDGGNEKPDIQFSLEGTVRAGVRHLSAQRQNKCRDRTTLHI